MFALHGLLAAYCTAHPQVLQGTQVYVQVDNQAAVLAFNKDRSRDTPTHWLLLDLFALQVRHGFWLRLQWVPTEVNKEADLISRPGIEEHVRLKPEAFAAVWKAFGPFQVDLMATAQSAQRVPKRGKRRG